MTSPVIECLRPRLGYVRLVRLYWNALASLAGLSFALLPSPVFAQGIEGSWEAVRQLQGGETIVVVDRELKSFRGIFLEASENEIRFETGGRLPAIERINVLRVSKLVRSKRNRNTILGAAIGAGAGAAGGAALAYGLFPDEGGATKPTITGVSLMATGTVLGVLLGRSTGLETVYRAAGNSWGGSQDRFRN